MEKELEYLEKISESKQGNNWRKVPKKIWVQASPRNKNPGLFRYSNNENYSESKCKVRSKNLIYLLVSKNAKIIYSMISAKVIHMGGFPRYYGKTFFETILTI